MYQNVELIINFFCSVMENGLKFRREQFKLHMKARLI